MTTPLRSLRFRLASLALGGLLLAGCSSAGQFAGSSALQGDLAARAAAGGHHTKPLAGTYGLIVEPDMGVGPLLQAINGAQHSIRLEMYMFTTSNAAGQLLQALIARKQAGVDVQVILEAQPYMPASAPKCQPQGFNPNTKALQTLTQAGVRVKWSSPRFVYTHEKSMVIDNQTAYIMTTNFTGAAFSANREYVVIDHDPGEVAEVAAIFDADWTGAAIVPKQPNLVVSPVNSRSKLIALIDSAQRSLMIQIEFIADPAVFAHLQARVKAGVATTVMLSSQAPNACSGQDVNADEVKALNAAGVTNVAFIKTLTMHGKMVIADGARAYVGSENLTSNSLDNNREMGVLVSDPNVVAALGQVAAKDWANRSTTPVAPVQPDSFED